MLHCVHCVLCSIVRHCEVLLSAVFAVHRKEYVLKEDNLMEYQDLRKVGDNGRGVVGERSAGEGREEREEEEEEEGREASEEMEELFEEGGESDVEEVERQGGKKRGRAKRKITLRKDARHQLGSRGLTK